MATYDQLYKEFTPNLLQATINPRAIRDLLVELRPQFGELRFYNASTPETIALTDVPQQITIFTDVDSHNDEIVPSGQEIQVIDGIDGIYGHFDISTQFNPASNINVTFELYVDGAPFDQPVKRQIVANNGDWNAWEPRGHVSVRPDSILTLMVYKEGATPVNVDFYQLALSLHKVSFGLNSPFPGQILFQEFIQLDDVDSELLIPAPQQFIQLDDVDSELAPLPVQTFVALDLIDSELPELPIQSFILLDDVDSELIPLPVQTFTLLDDIDSELVPLPVQTFTLLDDVDSEL